MTIWIRPRRFALHLERRARVVPGAARELLDVRPSGRASAGWDRISQPTCRYVRPRVRRCYLPFVGVDPRRQSRGVAAAPFAPVLAERDPDRIVAYLEAYDRSRPFHAHPDGRAIRSAPVVRGLDLFASSS